MSELLLCALHRLNGARSATEIFDTAVSLAMDAWWPRSAWPVSSKQTAALLKGMEAAGTVKRSTKGCARENGRDVPIWEPAGLIQPQYQIPDPPDRTKKKDLDGMTKPQIYALVDVLSDLVHEGGRQRRELGSLLVRQLEEFERTTERAKRQLLAAGIEGEL